MRVIVASPIIRTPRYGIVMPSHSSLPFADCVNLSAMPGIHVLTESSRQRRGWPGQALQYAHISTGIDRLRRKALENVSLFNAGSYALYPGALNIDGHLSY